VREPQAANGPSAHSSNYPAPTSLEALGSGSLEEQTRGVAENKIPRVDSHPSATHRNDPVGPYPVGPYPVGPYPVVGGGGGGGGGGVSGTTPNVDDSVNTNPGGVNYAVEKPPRDGITGPTVVLSGGENSGWQAAAEGGELTERRFLND